MTSKELAEIFEKIELELISSLKRNLKKHQEWEKDLDIEWTAWQALKIKGLERFRKENSEILSQYTDLISAETRKMIEEQFNEGEDLESEQLEEYGFTETTNDNFFEIFDEKIESIIEEIQGKETTAEKAALRMMDDVYRQTLLKAETAVATGSQTIPKAIEEAVREFAKKGINCIEYRDGRRVNIADYVYMALRTANTRAGLLGQAKQRMSLGIDTVRVSSYNACSETCLPWQGGIYIDDVFATFDGEISGDKGKSKNGNWYTLLSVAVRAGLFHPNCRHSLTTYTGNGKDSPKVDEEKARENYKLEQQQRALERKLRYWKRRLEAENDPVLKEGLKNQVKKARDNLKTFVDEHKDVLRRDPWREKTYNTKDETKALKNIEQQHQRYRKLLGDIVPETLAEFENITYNEDKWKELQYKYRTVNRYEVDGNVSAEKILELDNAAYYTKQKGFDYSAFSGKQKRRLEKAISNGGNAATMEFDGQIYFSHSKFDIAGSFELSLYKGEYPTIALSENPIFKVNDLGDGVPRQYDTEAKFLEFVATKKNYTDAFTVTILSEKHICKSCQNVVAQFKQLFPNATINIISGKRGYNGSAEGLHTYKYRKKVK